MRLSISHKSFRIVLENGKKPPLSCDFESNNLCGWVQDVNHDFDWTKYNLNTTTWHIQYGPAYDHTKGPNGNGKYDTNYQICSLIETKR